MVAASRRAPCRCRRAASHRQIDLEGVSVFCRHNRFTAECPICSKGTVLDPNLRPSRPRRSSGGTRRPAGARRSAASAGSATLSRGVFAAAGPYDDGREVRLEKVPGGLRLAAWHAGQLVRGAPVLELRDLPVLLAEAAQKELLAPVVLDATAAGAAGRAATPTAPGGHGASPGRSGELRDELRVERLEGDMLRIARWIMRPNRGWELQEAPVMLPPARFAEALEAAATAGALGPAALPSDPAG
jgi:hypothetical protein